MTKLNRFPNPDSAYVVASSARPLNVKSPVASGETPTLSEAPENAKSVPNRTSLVVTLSVFVPPKENRAVVSSGLTVKLSEAPLMLKILPSPTKSLVREN